MKIFIHLALMGLAASCFNGALGGKGKTPFGFLSTGNAESLSLEDDLTNQLNWKSASDGEVIGNILNPVINGSCSGVSKVELWADGTLKKSVPCANEKFQFSFSNGDEFTSGVYQLEFKTNPSSVVLERTYDVLSVAPSTLVSLGSVPPTSIYISIDFTLICHSDLTLSIAGNTLDCDDTDTIVQAVPLVYGTNSFTVTWIDRYRNRGESSYSVVRNPAGTPEISSGVISAISSSTVNLTNCTGACDGTSLSNAAIIGFQAGITNQDVPLSRASISGGAGETISIGNHSYIFCEKQNASGECIP